MPIFIQQEGMGEDYASCHGGVQWNLQQALALQPQPHGGCKLRQSKVQRK